MEIPSGVALSQWEGWLDVLYIFSVGMSIYHEEVIRDIMIKAKLFPQILFAGESIAPAASAPAAAREQNQ